MEQTKSWLRWPQITGKFPENKYFFDKYLKDIGDWVETDHLTKKELKNFKDAAHIWAWRRKWAVQCQRIVANEEKTRYLGRQE
jgi:hypothetical protein